MLNNKNNKRVFFEMKNEKKEKMKIEMLDAFVTEFGSFYRNPRHEAVCVSFFDSLHDLFNTLNRLSRRRHHLFNKKNSSTYSLVQY